MSAVGYREINEAFDQSAVPNLDALTTLVVQKTRVFARRQRTWLREQPVTWFSSDQANDPGIGEQTLALLNSVSD
jgi:tRNA A37 N6-isopentenylltransferase MiaA